MRYNMSHIICPLCGKNAPLSTFDPGSLPLDLMTISFMGLGRGRGFAVKEKVSIMGDETYTPIVAARIRELFNLFVEKEEINLPIAINNDASILMQINELKKQVVS